MSRSRNGGSNVKVVCRFRPMIDIELELGGENKDLYTFPTEETVVTSQGDSFTFDKIYSTKAEQAEIFEFVGKPIVEDVLTGYNGTVIAYGQTGAGKSYTMMGLDIYNPLTQGVIPRAIHLIFESVQQAVGAAEFTLKCSMLEIYKEKLKDLCGYSAELKIKENKAKGIYVDGITEVYVASEEEMLEVLSMGERNRTVASTKMNSVSSRSHQLFMLEVKQKLPNDSEKKGTLNLVDLAGSEKINQTGVTGNKLEEAKKINLSLSALGNVIKALTSSAEHIPYRDSKLTRLLQESLGGNYKTTLIVNCSPHPRNAEDTVNTLKFAQRAKTIKNKVHLNIKKSAEAYMKIIEELKGQLRAAYEEAEFWKNQVSNHGPSHNPNHRRSSTVKVILDQKPIRIPEVQAEDEQDSCEYDNESISEESNPDVLKEENYSLKIENEDLKAKVQEITEKLNKETKKRILNEKKYFECFETYNKLLLSVNESTNKSEYLFEENSSLYRQIEALEYHIQIISHKFSNILEKLKNGENVTEWEFSDNSEQISGVPVYTQDNTILSSYDKNESNIGISVDPETLLAQDCYAQEICMALEESSLINQDIIIFELKKQIISSGLVNCNLFRLFSDLKLKENLLREKFSLKVKLVKFQEKKLNLYETMFSNLKGSYDKLAVLIERYEFQENIKNGTFENLKKAKIARPIKGSGHDHMERDLKRGGTITSLDKTPRTMHRQSTSISPNNEDVKFRALGSGLQMQFLHNQQLKSELEIVVNERNTYKSLYSSIQSDYLDIYTKEKSRWKKYFENFKENCNGELMRRQQEINKLNTQIAHWMNTCIELQHSSEIKLVKNYSESFATKKKPIQIDSFSKQISKVQLLHSPLHSDLKQSKLTALNCQKGDVSPPVVDDN